METNRSMLLYFQSHDTRVIVPGKRATAHSEQVLRDFRQALTIDSQRIPFYTSPLSHINPHIIRNMQCILSASYVGVRGRAFSSAIPSILPMCMMTGLADSIPCTGRHAN